MNVIVKIVGENIKIKSDEDMSRLEEFDSLLRVKKIEKDGAFYYVMPLSPVNAFTLRHLLKHTTTLKIPESTKRTFTELADRIFLPSAELADTGKHIEVRIPFIENYKKILNTVNAYPLSSGAYRFPIIRLQDFELLNEQNETYFPKIQISKEVLDLNREPLPGFDGSIESLKEISIDELNVIKSNPQSVKSRKKSKKTLAEKIKTFGISNLYDLIFWTPRRYIDKTEPQLLRDLIEGESATILGKITEVGEFSMGIYFMVGLPDGSEVKATFFRQQWLRAKFKVGMEVLITGKVKFWYRQIQISGASIEHAAQASLLPIVPIYSQSESRGITTALLLSAQRELFSRLNDTLELPHYFIQREDSYYDLLKELHFPTDLKHYRNNIDKFAYYELIYTQILIEAKKELEVGKEGLVQTSSEEELQKKLIGSLPFELTGSQVKARERVNRSLAEESPANILLSADVGAGKTVVAQIAAMQSVDAGYQVVIIGPTEILAEQLYRSTEEAVEEMNKRFGTDVIVESYNGSMRAAEKRTIAKRIKDGEVDIIVGTPAAMGKTVEYKNLGLIIMDEQQKYGTEQRDVLLDTREDGHIPDFMMMTATPIPRSTAQIYFGDVELIQLKDKPEGRLPIETEWIEEDPLEFSEQVFNNVWNDLHSEAEKGHQTFIIAPLVKESAKVDASSVEKIYRDVNKYGLAGLKIGYVHGQMKSDDQREAMEKFKNGDYQVLVASTVVEVGVDIPDATRMVVMSADRLGASSLHQIRGRIGRSSLQSKCYLVSSPSTENGRMRLESLVENDDGFEVAKQDLLLRGQGTLFSTIQSGKSEMLFATLTKHSSFIKKARGEAKKILEGEYREEAIKDAEEKFQ